MELVSVELPKRSKEETGKLCEPCDSGEKWPYGLQLRFQKEQVDQLPVLKDYKIGERIIVTSEAVVTSISQNESKDNVSYSIEMQIEKVACEPVVKKALSEMTLKEYKKARGIK
jgi:hypothetical protein